MIQATHQYDITCDGCGLVLRISYNEITVGKGYLRRQARDREGWRHKRVGRKTVDLCKACYEKGAA